MWGAAEGSQARLALRVSHMVAGRAPSLAEKGPHLPMSIASMMGFVVLYGFRGCLCAGLDFANRPRLVLGRCLTGLVPLTLGILARGLCSFEAMRVDGEACG